MFLCDQNTSGQFMAKKIVYPFLLLPRNERGGWFADIKLDNAKRGIPSQGPRLTTIKDPLTK